MLQLANAQPEPPSHTVYCTICTMNIFYRKDFVSIALPEELADGGRKPLAAAISSSLLKVPPN